MGLIQNHQFVLVPRQVQFRIAQFRANGREFQVEINRAFFE